jgi:IS5 family transposase
MEDALYEITSMRLFARLSLEGTIPDHNHYELQAFTGEA